MQFQVACRSLIEAILNEEIADDIDLSKAKKEIALQCNLKKIPKNSEILAFASPEEKPIIKKFLQRKPVRTISGVAVIAVMTSPHPCPHGRCIPCPGGPESEFASPQSYTGREPAALRAFQENFDPYLQTTARLRQLKQIGHEVDKAELIIMGGTITARSLCYQEWFVKRCIEAMNNFEAKKVRNRYMALEEVQRRNELAKVRNVGITFETRPDWCMEEHVDRMLHLGVTKVELGVQSIYDYVLCKIGRGHSVAQSIKANQILRDSGLKVGFHIMPGLPGSSFDQDLKMFERLFQDECFKPDYLKIYPTLLLKGTKLYEMWLRGEYEPLSIEQAVELIARAKLMLPRWVRVQRVQRDIPVYQVEAGIKKSNLRQLVFQRLREIKAKCKCIRCREVGHALLQGRVPSASDIKLIQESYTACGGREYFISYEDLKRDILIGFLRLRFPFKPHRRELQDAAIVRELHVYGPLVSIGKKPSFEWQHRGYGEMLLRRAEEIAKEAGYTKLAVTSGIGVRDYYRKRGYRKYGAYMMRVLK
jgi:elongator complex protein 3